MTSTPAHPQPEPSALPPQTRAERRMGRLEQMGDQGVEIGRLLTQQARFAAVHATTEAVPDNRPHAELLSAIAAAHARVTRAVALAAAVEDRIDKGLPAIPEPDRARRVREDLAAEKRARLVCEIDRGLDDLGHRPLPRVRLGVELMRLLDTETADLDRFLARPFPELAARLRRDLGLKPTADDEAWLGTPPPPDRGDRGGDLGERGRTTTVLSKSAKISPVGVTSPGAQPAPASPSHHLRWSPSARSSASGGGKPARPPAPS